jgi:putative transcription factor
LPGFQNNRIGPPRRVASHTNAPIERLPKIIEESDVTDEYANVIKEARSKLGLSQQDLAFKAKEKVTVIQKIEIGKMLPTVRLAKELEHILHVRLLVPAEEVLPVPKNMMVKRPPSSNVTLGDIALVKNKEKQS